MNSIRSKAIVFNPRLLRSTYTRKLHAYPSPRMLLRWLSDSRSVTVDLTDVFSTQVIIVFNGREQTVRGPLAMLKRVSSILIRHKLLLCHDLSRGM